MNEETPKQTPEQTMNALLEQLGEAARQGATFLIFCYPHKGPEDIHLLFFNYALPGRKDN